MNTVFKLLVGALVSVPFLFPHHDYPLVTFYAEFFTLYMALIVSAALVLASNVKWRDTVPGYAYCLPAYAAYILIQNYALGLPYWQHAAIAAFYLLTGFLVIVACRTTVPFGGILGRQRAVLIGVAAGGFLLAMTGYIQYFHIDTVLGTFVSDETIRGMMGFIGQRSVFAAYVACGLVAVLCLRLHWAIALLLVIPMTIAEVYAGSRIAWVFMVALLVIAYINEYSHILDKQGTSENLAIAFAMFALFLLMKLSGDFDVLGHRADTIAGSATQAFGSRADLVWTGLKIWMDYPLFGAGWGEFSYQYFLHTDGAFPPDRHAHNIIVQVLAETGLVGLGILLTGVSLWLRRMPHLMSVGLFGILAIIGIFSFSEFPLWHAQFFILACVASTMCCGMAHGIVQSSWWTGIWIWIAAVLGCLVMMVAFVHYDQYSDFVNGKTKVIYSRGLFRPEVERTALLVGTRIGPPAVYERVLHAGASPELLCKYAQSLDAVGRDSDTIRQRVILTWGKEAACL